MQHTYPAWRVHGRAVPPNVRNMLYICGIPNLHVGFFLICMIDSFVTSRFLNKSLGVENMNRNAHACLLEKSEICMQPVKVEAILCIFQTVFRATRLNAFH